MDSFLVWIFVTSCENQEYPKTKENKIWTKEKIEPSFMYNATYQWFAPGQGREAGNQREIWHFQFSNVNFTTLGSSFWVKFPSLGQTNRRCHNSLYCCTERLQIEILTWWQNNSTHKLHPKCRRHVLAGYLVWLASTFELFHTAFTGNTKCAMPSLTWHSIIKKG